MKIVLYTQSEQSQQLFSQIMPAQLPCHIYTCDKEFTKFLESLKVPCQILLDLEFFSLNIEDFLDKNSFHHIICLKDKVEYELSLQLIKKGSLLTTWSELWSMHWWWNRSLINFEKTTSENIAKKSILLLPHCPQKSYKQFIEQNFWRTLFAHRPLIGKFDGRHSYSRIYSELESFYEMISSQNKPESFQVVAQFDYLSHISPYGFKDFIKRFCEFFKNIDNVKLFLLSDENQYAFDKILIPCFEQEDYHLYKMNLESLEQVAKLHMQEKNIDTCIFEHIKIGERKAAEVKKS